MATIVDAWVQGTSTQSNQAIVDSQMIIINYGNYDTVLAEESP